MLISPSECLHLGWGKWVCTLVATSWGVERWGLLASWTDRLEPCHKDQSQPEAPQGPRLLGSRQATHRMVKLEPQAWEHLGALGLRVGGLAKAHQGCLQRPAVSPSPVAEMVSEQPVHECSTPSPDSCLFIHSLNTSIYQEPTVCQALC